MHTHAWTLLTVTSVKFRYRRDLNIYNFHMANRSNFVPSMLFVIFLLKFVNFRDSFQPLIFQKQAWDTHLFLFASPINIKFHSMSFQDWILKTGSQVNVTSLIECLVEQTIIETDNSSEASSCSQEKHHRASNLSLEQSGIVQCPSGFGPPQNGTLRWNPCKTLRYQITSTENLAICI